MNRITSLLLTLGFSLLSFAQINEKPHAKKWLLTRIDFAFTAEHDVFRSMNYSDLMVLAKDKDVMSRNLAGLSEEANGTTGGAALYVNAAFSIADGFNGNNKLNQEVQLGYGMHTDKEAMVSFKDEETDTSIVFCNLHTERSLNATYVINRPLGKRWNVYAGLGARVSWTKGNEMMVLAGKYFEEGIHPSMQEYSPKNVDRYQARAVVYNRFYIPYGIAFTPREKWSYGLDIRKGFGFQHVLGGTTNFMKKSGSFSISFKRNIIN